MLQHAQQHGLQHIGCVVVAQALLPAPAGDEPRIAVHQLLPRARQAAWPRPINLTRSSPSCDPDSIVDRKHPPPWLSQSIGGRGTKNYLSRIKIGPHYLFPGRGTSVILPTGLGIEGFLRNRDEHANCPRLVVPFSFFASAMRSLRSFP